MELQSGAVRNLLQVVDGHGWYGGTVQRKSGFQFRCTGEVKTFATRRRHLKSMGVLAAFKVINDVA